MIAYCARYGHQPYSELAAMPFVTLQTLARHIAEIVRAENDSGREG